VREEGTRDVPATLVLCQPSLARRPSCPCQEWAQRELPLSGKLTRQPLSGVMSTLQPAVRITRDEDDTAGIRSRQRVPDDCCGPPGEATHSTLLPGDHDLAQPVVIHQHGARMRERKPASGALAAASYGPGRRGAATGAKRWLDAAQRRRATVADLRSRERTDKAALREEQVEHVTTLWQRV
jgi:hypothetical protein